MLAKFTLQNNDKLEDLFSWSYRHNSKLILKLKQRPQL